MEITELDQNEIRTTILTSFVGGGGSNINHHIGSTTPAPTTGVLTYTQALDPHRSSKSAHERYRECLRNHAASVGGNVYDGCGEFMPGGEEGTLEALKCAACDCHRNFHRKVPSLQLLPAISYQRYPPVVQSLSVAYGGNNNDSASSEEELNDSHVAPRPPPPVPYVLTKKRFRTKFTGEQKERMMEFAEQIGWRINRHDEGEVDRFCEEAGIRRQVFKVWMHNNKNLRKGGPGPGASQNDDQDQPPVSGF